MKNAGSIIIGFLVLFAIYHFPEFFDAFWIAAVFKIGFLIVAFLVARFQGWKGLEGFGLSFRKRSAQNLVFGLLTGIAAFVLSIVLSVSFSFEELLTIKNSGFFLDQLPLVLLMTFFPSIAEDILTRGYLLGHFPAMQKWKWVFLSSFVYVLNHIWRLNEDVSVLSYLFLLGLVLALSVQLTRSLWLALGIHWGANIGYELSRTGLQLKTNGYEYGPTWMLALAWGIVLIIVIIISSFKSPRQETKDSLISYR
jgi:uncharacterized protein